MAIASVLAQAQEAQQKTVSSAKKADDDELQEIIVTGIRKQLETAAEIKRKADTFVDSITSADVSSLPDLSVAEALQRVPGVTVTRFPYGGASPDFPSPEGQGNLIRGLGFVRSEFNGRDAFSANGGRALDWSSVPIELVHGVDVYKNQSADLIEGGIGGTINLRTLQPFDQQGHILLVSADETYADLRKKWSPSYSLVAGNRWQTDSAGEFGILGGYSNSKLHSFINGWQQGAPTPRTDVTQSQASGPAKFVGQPASAITAYVPGFQLRTNEVDRDRKSYYVAAQWQKDTISATLNYVRVENSTDSLEHTTEWFPDHDGGSRVTMSNLTINKNWSAPSGIATCSGPGGQPNAPGDCETMVPIGGGLMESGLVTDTGDSWTGAYGLGVGDLGIGKHDKSMTQDVSLNVKWNATQNLNISFDAQLTKANSDYKEVWGGVQFYADAFTAPSLEHPKITFSVNPLMAMNASNTRVGGASGVKLPHPTSVADPNDAFWLYAADSFREGTGELKAFRSDLKYNIEGDDWFKAIRFGVRYSERDQVNKEIGLNWGGIAPAWAGGAAMMSQLASPASELVDFKDFFRGGVVQGSEHMFPFIRRDLLLNYTALRNYITNEPTIGTNHPWAPRGKLDGTGDYHPEDISDITESTSNAYLRFDFGRKLGDSGMNIDGNFGARYTRTKLTSAGSLSYQPFSADPQNNSPADLYVNGVDASGGLKRIPDVAEAHDAPQDFLPETTAYLQQAARPIKLNLTDSHWLPSFNVKWNLNSEMLIRFAASKAMTRPNVQDMRASQLVQANTTRTNYAPVPPTDPLFGVDRGAANIRLDQISVSRGNPLLKPTTAVSLDLAYEWYFHGGSATVTVFQKDLTNIITSGDQKLGSITLDGQTVNQVYSGQVNQNTASVKGYELAYLQFFDSLPGWMSHLGVQANYTHVSASADPPGSGLDANHDGVPDDLTTAFRFGVKDLLGQSEHMANIVGIYNDPKLELRLAYNWRSQYLTTYRDWVTGNPIYAEGGGFLDASFAYNVNSHLKVRAEIANVLDRKEKAHMMINSTGQTAPRFAFLNDRRMQIGVQYKF